VYTEGPVRAEEFVHTFNAKGRRWQMQEINNGTLYEAHKK
jgi:hypothetical protein